MKFTLLFSAASALAIYSSQDSSSQTFLTEITRESTELKHTTKFNTFTLHFPTNSISYKKAPSTLVINYDSTGEAFHVHAIYSNKSFTGAIGLTHVDPTPITRPILPLLPPMNSDGSVEKGADANFFSKYWFYFVPILIILMLGGGGEEEPAGPRRRQ